MRVPPRAQRQPLVPPGGIDHHVRDMTATMSADLTLEAAQALLAKENQWLPIDGNPRATLAHLVETNSTGPLRLGYGAWRDLLLGCQFRSGSVELITAGGRTVKNVAGYDLTKFMVGQYGIFGKIVTITTRTYRKPQTALLAKFPPDVKHLNTMLTTTARPQWSLLTGHELLCGYLGDGSAIEFYQSDLPKHHPRDLRRQSLEEDVALRASLWSHEPTGGAMRASVPPASIRRFVEDAKLVNWTADAAFGVVLARCQPADVDRINKAADSVGGSVIFHGADGSPLNLARDPSTRALLERLKYAFDPDSHLAPLPL